MNSTQTNHSIIGFVSSYAGLLVVRFLLGLLEGPMFPGIVLYLSGFYTRRDLSLRQVDIVKNRKFISLDNTAVRIGLPISSQLHRFLVPSQGCLPQQYRIWMGWEENRAGHGFLYSYVFAFHLFIPSIPDAILGGDGSLKNECELTVVL